MKVAASANVSVRVAQRANMLLLGSATSKKEPFNITHRNSDGDLPQFKSRSHGELFSETGPETGSPSCCMVRLSEPPRLKNTGTPFNGSAAMLEAGNATECDDGIDIVYGSKTVRGFTHANEDRLAMAIFNFSRCKSPSSGSSKRHSLLQPIVTRLGSACTPEESSGTGETIPLESFNGHDTRTRSCGKHGYVWICCDGHDGPQAADYFIQNFPGILQRMLLTEKDTDNSKSSLSQRTHKIRTAMILAHLETDGAFRSWVESTTSPATRCTSGTCVTSVFMCGTQIWFANLGDCTAWILRRNHNRKKISKSRHRDSRVSFTKATIDHRASEVSERMRISRLHGSIVCGRVGGMLEPSRTIGDFDVKDSQPPGVVSCIPDIRCFDIDGPALILLGTDGIWDAITEEEIVPALMANFLWDRVVSWLTVKEDSVPCKQPATVPNQDTLTAISKMMIKRARQRGSEDDASCTAIHVVPRGNSFSLT